MFHIRSPLLLCLTLSTISCKKDDDNKPSVAVVEGQVTDKITGKPIPHAIAYLVSKGSSQWTAMGMRANAAQETDDQGRFRIEFTWDDNLDYTLYGKAKNYFETTGGGTWVEPRGPRTGLTIPLQPIGYIRYVITNEAPFDTARLSVGDYIWYPPEKYWRDTILFDPVSGGVEHHIVYWITKKGHTGQGIKERYLDTIFCPSFDTVTYYVKY